MTTKRAIADMKLFFILVVLTAFCSCTTGSDNHQQESQETNYRKPLPPPMPLDEQRKCDSLKVVAYSELCKGQISLALNDTIRNNKKLYELFVLILKTRFGFNYFRLNDMGFETVAYKQCVQPIMDSAIVAKYGTNAKDSIITVVYGMADKAYKQSIHDK